MSKPEKKLFLLDAMALIYRAHFAFSKNPRITSKGMNTSAVFGFTNSLLEILSKEKPTHIAVAFDTHAPTFRHVEFPEYKAQREAQPEDIRVSVPIIKDLLKGFNIPALELDGYEADDIIGTFAKAASEKGFEVFMMTPDKDYAQLVEEHVYLYKPAYMGNGVDVLGIPEVLAKFDIENVDQVRDVLGLQGDAVDNIPGIPGVGAKTAVKLLKEYGSVENIVANSDQLKGALQKKVIEFGEQGIFSKKLATIVTDVPIEFVEEDLECSAPDEAILKPLFDELEFRTMANRVFQQEVAGATTKSKADSSQLGLFAGGDSVEESTSTGIAEIKSLENTAHEYHLVDTAEKRAKLISALAEQKEYCFDTETTGLEVVEAKLVGLAFSYKVGEAWYVPTPADDVEAKSIAQEFKEVLEKPDVVIIGQNLKYDIQIMRNYDVHINGKIFDTMLAHYLIDPETPHKMDVLAENYLGYRPMPIEDLIGKKGAKQG
ncbi:MAG: 5'-3' exonuclease H3TH domain-containing protein, partial [Bacteroidota bacterium]